MTEESLLLRKRRGSRRALVERIARWALIAFMAWAEYAAWQDYTRINRAQLVTVVASPTTVDLMGSKPVHAVVVVDRGACPSIEFPRSQLEVLRRMRGNRVRFTVEDPAASCAVCFGWSAEPVD